MLKGGFVNIQHKFFRVLGLAKMTLLMAFTLAGCNLEAIRSFLAKNELHKEMRDHLVDGLTRIAELIEQEPQGKP